MGTPNIDRVLQMIIKAVNTQPEQYSIFNLHTPFWKNPSLYKEMFGNQLINVFYQKTPVSMKFPHFSNEFDLRENIFNILHLMNKQSTVNTFIGRIEAFFGLMFNEWDNFKNGKKSCFFKTSCPLLNKETPKWKQFLASDECELTARVVYLYQEKNGFYPVLILGISHQKFFLDIGSVDLKNFSDLSSAFSLNESCFKIVSRIVPNIGYIFGYTQSDVLNDIKVFADSDNNHNTVIDKLLNGDLADPYQAYSAFSPIVYQNPYFQSPIDNFQLQKKHTSPLWWSLLNDGFFNIQFNWKLVSNNIYHLHFVLNPNQNVFLSKFMQNDNLKNIDDVQYISEECKEVLYHFLKVDDIHLEFIIHVLNDDNVVSIQPKLYFGNGDKLSGHYIVDDLIKLLYERTIFAKNQKIFSSFPFNEYLIDELKKQAFNGKIALNTVFRKIDFLKNNAIPFKDFNINFLNVRYLNDDLFIPLDYFNKQDLFQCEIDVNELFIDNYLDCSVLNIGSLPTSENKTLTAIKFIVDMNIG